MSRSALGAALGTALTFARYWRLFVRLVDPTTGRVVPATPTTKQADFIAAVDSGQYHEYFNHWSKQTSKSFTAAAWLNHHLVADPHHRGERLAGIASTDEDQSDIIFRECVRQTELHPVLSKAVRAFRSELVYTETRTDPATGGRITLDHRIVRLPRDLKGTHGWRFTRLVRDELWAEVDHAFSEALILSPSCASGAILYCSYYPPHTMMRAGAPFFDLHTRARASDPSLFYSFIGGDGSEASWRVCPWISPTWVERQRRILEASPSRFTRIILNQPAGPDSGGLLTPAELRAAMRALVEPDRGAPGVTYFVAVDLGVRFDWTVVLIGHIGEDGRLVVDVVRTWRPRPDQAVSLLAVADELRDLYTRFPWSDLVVDQSQSAAMVEMLQREGIPARILDVTAADQNRLTTGLKAAFARRLVAIPESATDLIEQLESVRAVETRRGLLKLAEGDRAAGDARAHDDLAFCLGLLIDMAGPELGRGVLPLTACNRQQSGLSSDACFLFSEPGDYSAAIYSSDPCCQSCSGYRHVVDRWRDDPQGCDLRGFRWTHCGTSPFIEQRREGRVWSLLRQNNDGRGGELIPGL